MAGWLLDTHALVWFALGDRERISRPLQRRIEGGSSIVSTASLWEIAIEKALGELEAPDPLDRLLIAQARVERLPVVTADPAFASYDIEVIWE